MRLAICLDFMLRSICLFMRFLLIFVSFIILFLYESSRYGTAAAFGVDLSVTINN